jgi:hypothetical protein
MAFDPPQQEAVAWARVAWCGICARAVCRQEQKTDATAKSGRSATATILWNPTDRTLGSIWIASPNGNHARPERHNREAAKGAKEDAKKGEDGVATDEHRWTRMGRRFL